MTQRIGMDWLLTVRRPDGSALITALFDESLGVEMARRADFVDVVSVISVWVEIVVPVVAGARMADVAGAAIRRRGGSPVGLSAGQGAIRKDLKAKTTTPGRRVVTRAIVVGRSLDFRTVHIVADV